LRQRGPDAWELRVYLGVDQESGRERWATKTVHGSRRHATAGRSDGDRHWRAEGSARTGRDEALPEQAAGNVRFR